MSQSPVTREEETALGEQSPAWLAGRERSPDQLRRNAAEPQSRETAGQYVPDGDSAGPDDPHLRTIELQHTHSATRICRAVDDSIAIQFDYRIDPTETTAEAMAEMIEAIQMLHRGFPTSLENNKVLAEADRVRLLGRLNTLIGDLAESDVFIHIGIFKRQSIATDRSRDPGNETGLMCFKAINTILIVSFEGDRTMDRTRIANMGLTDEEVRDTLAEMKHKGYEIRQDPLTLQALRRPATQNS